MRNGEILLIDLFAGPGGLGEGVSSCVDKEGNNPFRIGISVEKEASAHKTLTTRALYRKLKDNPKSLAHYSAYVRGEITQEHLTELYSEQFKEARQETLEEPTALGEDNERIHKRIHELIAKHDGPVVVIGGPPCQAYSLAGRSRNAGIKGYKAEDDHRNFLYLEYLKVLSIAQPEVFVMENVRGILSAKVDGKVIFPQILDDLKCPARVTNMPDVPGYRIYSLVTPAEDPNDPRYKNSADFLIRAEDYGVPQARHRVILLGVREDIEVIPDILTPANQQVTVEQVLSDLPPLRSGFSKRKDITEKWEEVVIDNASRLKRLLRNIFDAEKVDQLDLMPMRGLKRSSTKCRPEAKCNIPSHLKDWYRHNQPGALLNHATRAHMESDLLRYAYSAAYTCLNDGIAPKSRDFPIGLAPAHENWNTGAHADRFRTQAANKCSTTVTSHISKDGHYFIHYDPRQCRSLTVREAARLQTFPDNYFFEGNRTEQYVQVGNAVPPYLARQIGKIVLNLLDRV